MKIQQNSFIFYSTIIGVLQVSGRAANTERTFSRGGTRQQSPIDVAARGQRWRGTLYPDGEEDGTRQRRDRTTVFSAHTHERRRANVFCRWGRSTFVSETSHRSYRQGRNAHSISCRDTKYHRRQGLSCFLFLNYSLNFFKLNYKYWVRTRQNFSVYCSIA